MKPSTIATSLVLFGVAVGGASLGRVEAVAVPSSDSLIGRTADKLRVRSSFRVEGLERFFVHDMDPIDVSDDIVACTRKEMFLYRNHEGSFLLEKSIPFERAGLPLGLFNTSEEGEPKCFVLVRVGDAYEIDCYAWDDPRGPGTLLYRLKPCAPGVAPRGAFSDGSVEIIASFDADDDLSDEVYVRVSADSAGSMRHRILSYRGDNGAFLWRYDPPGCPAQCILEHAIEGRSRIVVCTSDPAARPCCKGTVDGRSWICVLSPRGDEEHRVLVSPVRTHATIAEFHSNETGLPEILVGRYSDSDVSPRIASETDWNFGKLDEARDRIVTCLSLPVRPVQIVAGDLRGDGNLMIVTVDASGMLNVLNPDFSSYKQSNDDEMRQRKILAVANLDEDPAMEIVCLGIDSLLVIRNKDAGLVAWKRFSLPLEASPVTLDTYSSVRALAVRNGERIDLCTLLPEGVARGFSWRRALAVTFLIVMGAILAVRMATGARRDSDVLSEPAAYESLLVSMEAFRHGGSSLSVLDGIGRLLKNSGDLPENVGSSVGGAGGLLGELETTVVPQLERMAATARRAGLPPPAWEGIPAAAARLRDSLGSLAAVSYQRPGAVDDALASLTAILEARRRIRDGLREHFSIPIESSLRASIAKRLDESKGSGRRLEYTGEAVGDGRAFVSPVVFDKIVDDLILNSISATGGATEPAIRISARIDGSRCKIDVTDNGCGIEESKWLRIFDRDFTTKEKGGFGLYYARTELAKFGGEIFVVTSRPGAGTTMRIVLDTVEQ